MANKRTFGFHVKDGWTFLRLDNGDVEVSKRMPIYNNDHEFCGFAFVDRFTIESNSWCSVVASMSRTGETSLTYQHVMELHNGS